MVGDKYVVTVAHCVYKQYEGMTNTHLFVKLGYTHLAFHARKSLISVKRKTNTKITPPWSMKNDIAVLELEHTVDLKKIHILSQHACHKSLSFDLLVRWS